MTLSIWGTRPARLLCIGACTGAAGPGIAALAAGWDAMDAIGRASKPKSSDAAAADGKSDADARAAGAKRMETPAEALHSAEVDAPAAVHFHSRRMCMRVASLLRPTSKAEISTVQG